MLAAGIGTKRHCAGWLISCPQLEEVRTPIEGLSNSVRWRPLTLKRLPALGPVLARLSGYRRIIANLDAVRRLAVNQANQKIRSSTPSKTNNPPQITLPRTSYRTPCLAGYSKFESALDFQEPG